jgi:hypothetical protein
MSKIIVFEHAQLKGDSMTLTAPDPNLVPAGWNDRISSLIVVSGCWEVFEHVDYKGSKLSLSSCGGPDGDGVYRDWNDWKGTNDTISSLKPIG